MVEVSDKVLDDAKKWLVEKSKTWTTGVCLGQCVDMSGKYLAGKDYGACHAWLRTPFSALKKTRDKTNYDWATADDYAENAKPFLTMTCHSKKRSKNICSGEACDFLVLWMAKESPFSQFILNRDDDKSLTEGGVVILCGPGGVTHAQCMWICKVLRFITEGAKAADVFMTLVKGGVDPMLAVLVASYVRTMNGATFGYTGLEGHSSVFGAYEGTPAGVVYGLLTRNFEPKSVNTRTVFSKPKNLKTGKTENPGTKIKGFCKPVTKSDGWGGMVKGDGADASELITRVLQWQAELVSVLPDYDGTLPPIIQPDPPQMPNENTVYLELDL